MTFPFRTLLVSLFLVIAINVAFAGQSTFRMPEKEIEGNIVSHKGSSLVVRMQDAGSLKKGDSGLLHKHFEESLFGGTVQGWMDVALVEVIKVEKDLVTFRIVEEHSTGTINGEPIDHFKTGKRVKLVMGGEENDEIIPDQEPAKVVPDDGNSK